MKQPTHLHIHVHDAFEEGKHPRNEAGQFAEVSKEGISALLNQHKINHTIEHSTNFSEQHGVSPSVYFKTGKGTIRLSNHTYGANPIDLRYGQPMHEAEAAIAQWLGLPMSSAAQAHVTRQQTAAAQIAQSQQAAVGRVEQLKQAQAAEAARWREIEENNARIRAEKAARKAAKAKK